MKTLDIRLENFGSIVLMEPLTEHAEQWIRSKIAMEPWQWLGNKLAIEPRYVLDIVNGMQIDGLIL